MTYTFGIMGGGNMGVAIVRGCVGSGRFAAAEFIVAEIDDRKRRLFAELGCETSADPLHAAAAGQIILAVKPQTFPSVSERIGAAVSAQRKVVISIMAGLRSTGIHRALSDQGGGGGGAAAGSG